MILVTKLMLLENVITEHLETNTPIRIKVNPTLSVQVQTILFRKNIFWASSLVPNGIKNIHMPYLFVDTQRTISFAQDDEPNHIKGYTLIDATTL